MAAMLVASALPALAQDGVPGCPGLLNAQQAHAQLRDDLVELVKEAAEAAGGNFGQVQSTFNHTACQHGSG